jgi:acetyl-CoA acetyltransferase
MGRVFVLGTGMTAFGKNRGLRSTSEAALREAVADAGVARTDVERIYYANGAAGVVLGQEMIRGQAVLRHAGVEGAQIVNVENACASGSTALMLAWEAVAGGRCDVAVVLGAEQLWHDDRERTLLALDGATDVADETICRADDKHSIFMDVYAGEARRYLADHDATREDLALVAVKNRRHAAMNAKAHYRAPQTADDVLCSRMVADPLTLPMCSPTSDGAAALVLGSDEAARRFDASGVEVRAVAMSRGRGTGSEPVREAATAAYEAASVSPEDLHLVELHDAAAPAELTQCAEIGLCERGEGHELLRRGETTIGGRIPVNASGGLLSRGHPLGATGCAQVVEIADQLRGRAGARQVDRAAVGMAVNGGGWLGGSYAVAVATVLVGAISPAGGKR